MDIAQAELVCRETLRRNPNDISAWRGLAEVLLRQGKLAAVELEIDRLRKLGGLLHEADGLAAKLAERLGRAQDLRGSLGSVSLKLDDQQQVALLPTSTSQPSASRAGPTAVPDPGASGLQVVREARRTEKIRSSLCMIARDSSRTLRACLASISPWVDEMVVVDTGSTDDTPEIARRVGARVFHFPWCDSFSAARNESLRHARGQWLLWMDSDDTIDAANGRQLRDLAQREHDPNILGFVMQVRCPGPGDDGREDVTVVDHVKMLRNHRNLWFEGRIHEQVLPSIRRAGGKVMWTDIFVVHSGYDHSPEGQKRKIDRDLRLLHMEVAEQPNHPFTLFNLGMTYTDIGRYEEAAGYLSKSIQVSQPSESHLRKAYALLVYDYRMLGRVSEAWDHCQRALTAFPDDPELRFRSGVLLHEMGQYEDAVLAYKRALDREGPLQFGSYDLGIRGFKARHNLALTLAAMGKLAAAEVQWREVIREKPSYRAGLRGLADILVKQGKYHAAQALADRLDAKDAERAMIRAQVLQTQGDVAGAREELEAAVVLAESDREPLSRLCRLLFEHGTPAEAEPALRRLVATDPDDGAAQHNLGAVYLRLGRLHEAAERFRESLKLRPNSAETHLYLGYALQETGSDTEAIACWHDALRIAPNNAAAQEALNRVQPKPAPVPA